MSIASEITDLTTNLAAAKTAVTTKGGTVGDTGLAGLATEIATIPSGGGNTPSEWGRIKFMSFSYSWEVTYNENCTVTIVDNELFNEFFRLNVPRDCSNVSFTYDNGEWVSDVFYEESEIRISEGDFSGTTGVEAVIDDPEMGYASFSLQLQLNISNTQVAILELSEDMYNNMWNSASDSIGNYCFSIIGDVYGGELLLPKDTIIGFEMGTEPTSIPNSFLGGCGYLTELDMTNASNLTSIGMHFMSGCARFNDDITLPSSLTSIGTYFMYQCNQMVSTVDVGNLDASIIATSNYTFATPSSTAASYTTGITIAGTNRAAWLSRFPNQTSNPYRKLLDAGH